MTTDTLRQVFGTLRSPNGSAYPNKSLKWFRERRVVVGQGSSVVLDEPFIVATDAAGEIDINVMAGAYLVLAPLSDADRYFRVVVPDQVGPFDISSLIDGPTVEPDDLTQFEALVAKAKAWANAPEDSIVESGEFSAKHYAAKAHTALDASIAKAAQWADSPEDVEVETGRYSAKHWAAKSEDEKLAAQTARTGAETAELNAETARDAAFVNALVYADTAAGLAATTEGQQFQVVSGDEIIRYRHDAGPVATELARYPAASALDFKSNTLVPFQIVDENDNLLVEINSGLVVGSDGKIETDAVQAGQNVLKWALAICDAAGNLALGVSLDGQVTLPATDAARAIKTRRSGGSWGAEIAHVICYGQSLSVGQAKPVISVVQNYDNIMFEYGMRPQYDYPTDSANWYDSFVPAVEEQSPVNSNLGETPSMGTGDAIKELVRAEYGIPHTEMAYQILLSNPGFGATTIAGLSRSTTHYNRLLAQVTAAKALADAAGQTYFVPAVTWLQGEQDVAGNTRLGYAAALRTLASHLDADIKAITGQSETVQLVSYQLTPKASTYDAKIALAIADAAGDTANIHLAMPMYMMTHPDGLHFDGVGARWSGAYLGRVVKHVCIDGETWRPLEPLAAAVSGAIVRVTFHVPEGNLVFDTDAVREATAYGFILKNGSGVAQNITSVSIVAPNVVKIVCDTTIGADWTLEYATTGDSGGVAGPVTGARGNLRDTAGKTYTFDPSGIAKPMHNWCRVFEMEL